MESALQRLAGVEKVYVDLLKGDIRISPKKDFRLDPLMIAKLISDSGVTLHETSISARGAIVRGSGGGSVFRIQGSNQEYQITRNARFDALKPHLDDGQEVMVSGIIFSEKTGGKGKKKIKKGQLPPATIEITEHQRIP